MKVFDDLAKGLEVGQAAYNFPIPNDRMLFDLKGTPIFLIFWKTL